MQTFFRRLFLALVLSGSCFANWSLAVEEGFQPLCDGKTLDGWVQRGGKAKYEVKDGAIVGTSVANTPNSFLCTARDYGDFILTVELKVDEGLNSGIQIRSHMHDEPTEFKGKKIPAGRVHGYQVEIDNKPHRSWSGGIYDEGRRGWLYPLEGEEHKAAREAFKWGEWNEYRIQARGNSIKTWVNDVPVSDLVDDVDAQGFIALQVHSVGSKDQVGKQVRWRNIHLKQLKPDAATVN